MKTKNEQPIPTGINDYIKQNFSEDFLTEIKPVRDDGGILHYFVDVTHNNNVYHLKFNAEGALLEKEIEPVLYPDDELEIGEAD